MDRDLDIPLVVGRAGDSCLGALLAAFDRCSQPVRSLLIGAQVPVLAWRLSDGRLSIDGQPVRPGAVFVRHDVGPGAAMTGWTGRRTDAWTSTIFGWLEANPLIRTPNRRTSLGPHSEASTLLLARRLGLRVPATVITNDQQTAVRLLVNAGRAPRPALVEAQPARMEPPHVEGRLLAPVFVQERMAAPHVRIFVVGQRVFAFELRAPPARVPPQQDICAIECPPDIAEPLLALAHALDLEFCAADFKTTASDRALRFCDLNTSPPFGPFDAESGGALCDALAAWLTDGP